jgi:hypothetical protein
VAARKEAAVQLHVKGLSVRQIAGALGVPKSTVHDDLSETGQKVSETGQSIEVSERDILDAAKGIREGRARELRARNAELSKSPVLGVLAAAGVRCQFLTPACWKRAVGLPPGRDKDASRAAAIQRWPAKAELFSRKKDDGVAEAALIAIARLVRERAP